VESQPRPNFDDCLATTDRGHLALVDIGEILKTLATLASHQLSGNVATLLHRYGSDHRQGATVITG
jgi:hypothetical protein